MREYLCFSLVSHSTLGALLWQLAAEQGAFRTQVSNFLLVGVFLFFSTLDIALFLIRQFYFRNVGIYYNSYEFRLLGLC